MTETVVRRPRAKYGTPVRRALQCLIFGVALAGLAQPAAASPAPEGKPSPVAQAEACPRSKPRTSDELVQLYAAGVGYGALTGLWVQALGSKGSALSLLLPAVGVTGLALGTTAWLDHSDALTLGLPQAIATDTAIGLEIAAAWAWRAHSRAPQDEDAEWSSPRQTTLLWSGATVGAAIGIVRYALSPSTPARAAFTGSMTLWTGALSGLIAGAATRSSAQRDDHASLAAAISLEVGVVLSSFVGRWLDPSLGWVRALDVGATLGGSLVGGGYLLLSNGAIDDRATLGLAAAGTGAGLLAAALWAPRLGLPRSSTLAIGPDFGLGNGALGLSARGAF
jgi:hypothetical protein